MNQPRIYLDLDDVLNTLTMDILCGVFHCVPDKGFEHFPAHVGYDIIGAVAHIRGEEPMEFLAFWEQVPVSVWAEAPKSSICNWLVETAAELVGRDNVYVATATGQGINPLTIAAKVDWIRASLPTWLHEQYFITTHKWLLGRPGDILIDDSAANCAKFEDMGGDAILVPRPWNAPQLGCHVSRLSAYEFISRRLTDLFGVVVL
jgi:5'(3')-deoxyribonucleotidase